MDIVWQIVFTAVCIVGILASVFNWEWYFRLFRRFRFMDEQLGRRSLRIFNAVILGLILFGYFFLSFTIR